MQKSLYCVLIEIFFCKYKRSEQDMSAPVSCCEYNCIKQRRQMDRNNTRLCNEVQLFYDIPDKGWNVQDCCKTYNTFPRERSLEVRRNKIE
jgi:hypothetical protein